MRAREFLMKDAYSFHLDQDSLEQGYNLMHKTYSKAFERMGLEFRVVDADSGEIGGNRSQEFHVIADSGEDAIAYCDEENYAANIELTPTLKSQTKTIKSKQRKEKKHTPNTKDIASLCKLLKVEPKDTVKTLLLKGEKKPIAVVLRGDHQLNIIKAAKISGISLPVTMADEKEIKKSTGYDFGYIGPIDLGLKIYYDHAVSEMPSLICGANEKDYHFVDANFSDDLGNPDTIDLRNAEVGDPSPNGKGKLSIARGIEVGHIFQLGTKYSQALKATVQNDSGKDVPISMGCYGIGISRIVAAAIEQNHDESGIIWPENIAPFKVIIIPINMHKSKKVETAASDLYEFLKNQNIEVLFDDRKIRPGIQFADAELIGIPIRIVISEKGITNNQIEFRSRISQDSEMLSREEVIKRIIS